MVTNDKSDFNLEELASGFVADISKISETASTMKEPETMDDLDVSVFKMDSLRGIFNSFSIRMKVSADETAAQNKAQSDEVTETITTDLADRQVKFQTNLSAYKAVVISNTEKMTDSDKAKAEVVLKNVSNRAVIINRSVDELKVQKELKLNIAIPTRLNARIIVDK
jgi:hypothetical protein